MKLGKTVTFDDEDIDEVPLVSTKQDPATLLLDERLLTVRFDLNRVPPEESPVMWISDVEVAHPGNIVVVEGRNKSGKSA
jgi:hypothetical protein